MKHWTGNLGIVLIAIAIVPYSYVQFRLRLHNWNPLDTAVLLREGHTTLTAAFPTDLTGFYNVELAFAPNDVNEEECLIGDNLFRSCDKTGNGLDFDWAVFRSDAHGEVPVVAFQKYDPRSFGGAGYVGTTMGSFDALRGEHYRIALRVRQVAPELLSASPHIRVEAGRFYWERWVIFAQITLLFGAAFGIPGVALLVFGFILRRRKRLQQAVPDE